MQSQKIIDEKQSYPEFKIDLSWTIPVQISILGDFSAGEGDRFIDRAALLQQGHPSFRDEYNEPSACIAPTNFQRKDGTAVYSFIVDDRPLEFHSHKGRRVITGITGSKGADLVFCRLSPDEIEKNPEAFGKNIEIIHIPGDTLFNLKFDGQVAHQFRTSDPDSCKSAFFAVSVHPAEDEGLSGKKKKLVHNDQGSIPDLTIPVPSLALSSYRFSEEQRKCAD